MVAIAQLLKASLVVVPRPGREDLCSLAECMDLQRVLERLRRSTTIVLETNGEDISRIPLLRLCGVELSIVLGAEDYGIPPNIIALIRPDYVVRLPMSVVGASYNVVSSLIILLTHLDLVCRSSR